MDGSNILVFCTSLFACVFCVHALCIDTYINAYTQYTEIQEGIIEFPISKIAKRDETSLHPFLVWIYEHNTDGLTLTVLLAKLFTKKFFNFSGMVVIPHFTWVEICLES